MTDILVWWLLISALGLAVIPIALKVFRFLPDRGYAFTKPLGLLLFGLGVWLLGFVSFSLPAILLSFGLLAGFSFWIGMKNREEILAVLKARASYVLILELFFLLLFLGFLFFRMFNPDISGTENFMDLAFLNSISRASSFPPYDPWLAGPEYYISYYYLGYLLMSILIKISGTAPAVSYNLSLGLLFALSGTTLFGLVYNLTRQRLAGLGGWAAVFIFGTPAGFLQWFRTGSGENFNWFAPTRIIPNTINEFPFFSFLLGDIHPHMFSIPYVMISLGLALNHLKANDRQILLRHGGSVGRYFLWGLVIGALGFINSWDLPAAVFIAGLAFFFQQFRASPGRDARPWKDILGGAMIMLVLAVLPYLPFYLNFHSQVKGVYLTTQHTRISDYLLIFGVFVFMAGTFLVCRYHAWFEILTGRRGSPSRPSVASLRPVGEVPERIRSFLLFCFQPMVFWRRRKSQGAAELIMILCALAALAALLKSALLGIMILASGAVLILLLTRVDTPENIFVLLLLFTAGLIFLGCEIFYIKDAFPPRLHRMNTVFKFYYQAWFFMGLAGAYGVYWSHQYLRHNRRLRTVWLTLLILLIAVSLIYPGVSILAKTHYFAKTPTLDGSRYLAKKYPADLAGIEWLRLHAKGRPIVLEAIGPQFSEFARVSAFTGLPTVLGWAGHELQWRGNFDEPGRRIPDIDNILFGSSDQEKSRRLIAQYNIEYVFIGTLERNKYPGPALEKFAGFMDVVYEHPEGVTIYQRR